MSRRSWPGRIGIETVQFFLPTRAADVNDVFWNALGTLVGCVAAHVDGNRHELDRTRHAVC